MSNEIYDVVVIGGGPGGYVCAIRAAQLGKKVACVDKRGTLGGTCLNVGCIPSKALLQSSHLYEMAAHELEAHGIRVASPTLDLDAMLGRKDKVVAKLTKGIEYLFKKNKIAYKGGAGRISAANEVSVEHPDGGTAVLVANSVVIATGSDVATLPFLEIDERQVLSSTGALSLSTVPESMAVIGGGVIGLELGSVWRRLGAEVTVIEYMDNILPGMDEEIRKNARRILKKQGMQFKVATKVNAAEKTESEVILRMEPVAGGDTEKLAAEVVLCCVGRRPYTDGLGLDAVGVELTERGFVRIDENFRTSVADIYAIGDVVGGAMLAHEAEEEGIALAELLAGQSSHVNYDAIPGIVYTHPEIAAVGKTEEQLAEAGVDYKVGKFPFAANGRALANADAEGFAKILSEAKTDRILGAHIVGPQAGDLIQEVIQAMELGGSAEDVAHTCHGHPGLSEVVKEAALAVNNRAIHG